MIRPSNGAAPFELPDAPVDGYKVTWWRVEGFDDNVHVIECHATYYVHKKWNEYCPDRPGGADIIDSWMIQDIMRCRGAGWSSAWDLDDWKRDKYFSTKKEALEEVIRQLRMSREEFVSLSIRCADNIHKLLAELGGL